MPSFCTSALNAVDCPSSPGLLSPPGAYLAGCWKGRRTGQDALETSKSFCTESNRYAFFFPARG